jgi:PIN domain nuclease of toxin-antitoxin system
MKYLLDTHIWLWSSLQPDHLSSRVSKILADHENELWLSPISVWELALVCRKKRFQVRPDVPTWVSDSIAQLRIIEAPLTLEVALAIPSINLPHGDLANHFLAASAKVFDLTLVTADETLLATPGLKVLPNR